MERALTEGHQLVVGPIDYRRLNSAAVRAWRGAYRTSVITVLDFLPAGHSSNLAFTRKLYDHIGGLDESFSVGGDDVDFCWRAQLRGYALHEQPTAIVHYRLRPSMRALFRQAVGYGEGEAALYRKYANQGLHRRSGWAFVQEVIWLVTRLPFIWSTGRRGAWIRRLGTQWGRLRGAIKYRVRVVVEPYDRELTCGFAA